MPILLSDRAVLVSPLPLITASEGRMLGLQLRPPEYHRIRPGVWTERAGWDALPSWVRYQVRVHAYLVAHPDAVLCLESAAVAHGIPLFGEPRDIHVYDQERAASRRFGDVAVHTSSEPRDTEVVGGVRVTSFADTVVDLARVLPLVQGLVAADSAISPAQGGVLRTEELRSRSADRPSTRGAARQRWIWAHADERSESPGETYSRAVILWSGFEHPELQREYHYEGHVDRSDFHFRSVGCVGESDGWGKYRLDDPDAAARHLRNEKRREDRLRRHGHPFARWDFGDARRVDPVCRILSLAGVPLTRRAQPAMLATLNSAPRVVRA